ncbi:hypothetical protein EVAR_73012_1 [Eumeta japonica]|uniref:RNA-directed DNA polymerase from mobile element jockey n=1 Tax=Eumeta variegata TaxID=151549 RepID=A0A4C2AFS3_EUMVA|nr:hypothetical protein EVAR_73012_1 [Eumeta japonica]
MSENSIDIALVQETYLKPNRLKTCSIAGYVQLRTDRTYSRKGGTSPYYRRSLHCGPINIPPLTNMEATGCRLAMTGHSTLVIVSVYLPSPKRLLRRDLRALCLRGCRHPLRLDFGIIALYVDMFSHVVTHRPSTIDIALTKGVALNFNSIETIHGLTSDHRPVILKWDLPTAGGLFPSVKLLIGKESTALEEIDTPNLNSIPNDIASTDEIDFAIGALTNHVRTVVERASGGSGILGSPEVSARYSRIDKSKNAVAPRERISHEYRSRASSPTRSESSRSGIPK